MHVLMYNRIYRRLISVREKTEEKTGEIGSSFHSIHREGTSVMLPSKDSKGIPQFKCFCTFIIFVICIKFIKKIYDNGLCHSLQSHIVIPINFTTKPQVCLAAKMMPKIPLQSQQIKQKTCKIKHFSLVMTFLFTPP